MRTIVVKFIAVIGAVWFAIPALLACWIAFDLLALRWPTASNSPEFISASMMKFYLLRGVTVSVLLLMVMVVHGIILATNCGSLKQRIVVTLVSMAGTFAVPIVVVLFVPTTSPSSAGHMGLVVVAPVTLIVFAAPLVCVRGAIEYYQAQRSVPSAHATR